MARRAGVLKGAMGAEGGASMGRTASDGGAAHADRLAAAVIRGLPVTEHRLDLAGISTPVLQG
ncbi:MAG: hypothetical protein ACRDJ4_05505, partial [Actinomycetota bacterium]